MTTSLRPDDPRLDALGHARAAQLRAAMAEGDPMARRAELGALLSAFGLGPVPPGPVVQRAIADADRLRDDARLLLSLLAETDLDLARHPVYSVRRWLRQWLGLEPKGVLFRAIDDAGTTRTLLEAIRSRPEAALAAFFATLPIAERVEVLVELLDGGQDFRGAVAAAHLRTATRELDESAGAWASRAAADPRPPIAKQRDVDRERAIFVALARAKVPIEPEWDALVPLSHGSFARWAMLECLHAIPAARRAAAVLARLERASPGIDPVLEIGLEALAIVPDPSIARWLHERRGSAGDPDRTIEAIRALANDHPALREVVAGPVARPALVARAVAMPARLDALARAQHAALARGTERDEPVPRAAVRRFVLDRDETPAYDVWLLADSGAVFRAGTAEIVAEVAQGGIEIGDPTLRNDLRIALAAARRLPEPPKSVEGRAPARGHSKTRRAPRTEKRGR